MTTHTEKECVYNTQQVKDKMTSSILKELRSEGGLVSDLIKLHDIRLRAFSLRTVLSVC